jgi:hypothetical protein
MDETASAILDADLPSALQVTLLHVHRASENGVFTGTQGDIAEERGVHRGTVSSQFKDLKELGWLKKLGSAWKIVTDSTERRHIQQSVDSVNSEQGLPLGSLRFSPKKVHSTPISPSLLTPSQVRLESPKATPRRWLRPSDRWKSVKEPLPDDHPARWDHLPGDWTFDFAAAALEHFRSFDLLGAPTQKKIQREGEDYVIAQWGDTFRLLHEQDGYSRKEIKATMQWLFEGGNFWIEKQAIRSVPPLRSKTSSGDAYKFDDIYQQAYSADGQLSRDEAKQRPDENWQRLARAAASA